MVVFGSDNKSAWDFDAIWPRGRMIESATTSGGGDSAISVGEDVAIHPSLQLGRMVMATDKKLGVDAGMMDTPWTATLPVGISIYGLGYALAIRTPTFAQVLSGTVYTMALTLIEQINAQQELFVRPGDFDGDDIIRTETLDQRTYYEQLRALVIRAKKEMFLRPVVEDKTLIIYVDIKDQIGVDTQFELHDGKGANVQVVNAVLDGKIINCLTGIGSQSASDGRLQTEPQINAASSELVRLRSDVVQFPGVVDETTLLQNTINSLAVSSWAWSNFQVNILDVGDTWYHTRPGNEFFLHVSNLYYPGGVVGWRGKVRLTAMAIDEASGVVSANMEKIYDPTTV